MKDLSIDYILKRVLEEIEKLNSKPSNIGAGICLPNFYLIGESSCPVFERAKTALGAVGTFCDSPTAADYILAPNLSSLSLVNIANGVSADIIERQILNCFLMGKPVYLNECSDSFENCNPEFYKTLWSAKNKVKAYGGVFITVKDFITNLNTANPTPMLPNKVKKKLYTEKDILGLAVNSSLSAEGALFTPSAKDTIRERKIILT